MSLDTVAELVRRCAEERDPRLWEEFVARFGCRLRGGVRRALRRSGVRHDEEELSDLVQEVYCKLLENGGRNLARCRASAEPAVGAYLGRVAETVTIDRLRAAAAAKRGRSRMVGYPAHVAADPADGAVDPRLSPEERVLSRERRRLFLARCQEVAGPRFPQRDLRILRLAFLEGLSSREISCCLGSGITPSIVDSLVHRVKRRLAQRGVVLPRRREAV